MQPHRGAPHRPEPPPLVAGCIVDDVILDVIERVGKHFGNPCDRDGEMTDDRFEEAR